ncbi:pentapeptide repeat-containing protein, partial [Xanthomonas arboricola]
MNSDNSEDRPGTKIEGKYFTSAVHNEDFSNCRIEWCRAKKIVFVQCNFSSSMIKSCYFHRADFIECNFTGATIVDCNMRGASFESCRFEYASFRATYIESSSILRNLPSWENVRREFLRGLRKNAESVGEIEDVRKFFSAEMEASEEHWRSAFRQVEGYYVKHYSGFFNGRVKPFWKLFSIRMSRLFWGHGESPWKLVMSIVVWICLMTIIFLSPRSAQDFAFKAGELLSLMVGAPITNNSVP